MKPLAARLDLNTSYQIRFYSPSLGSSRRDVPAERLYKVLWVAEKGDS